MNLDDYEAEVRGSALRAKLAHKLAHKLEQLKALRQVIRFYREMYGGTDG